MQKIINLVKIKNIEINNNKIYITNLEETIKDLNKEFHQLRLTKKKENIQEITNLKNQLQNLQKEYQKLIEYNNTIKINRQLFNYNHISNNHIISRNYNINNFNNNGNKKIRIKMCVNNNPKNRLSYSSLNISNIVNEHKGKRLNSQKNIHNNDDMYDVYNDMISKDYYSPKQNNLENKTNSKNNNNNLNMKNIKMRKLGNIRYKSNLNINQKKKFKNKSQSNISSYNIKDYKFRDKTIKKEIETPNKRNKNVITNDFRYKISNKKNIDILDNDIKNKNNNIIGKPNLFNQKIGYMQNEKIEKQKIEEFKNLIEQIVNDIEN